MLPHIWRAGRSGSLIALPQHKPGAWLTADLSNTGGGGGGEDGPRAGGRTSGACRSLDRPVLGGGSTPMPTCATQSAKPPGVQGPCFALGVTMRTGGSLKTTCHRDDTYNILKSLGKKKQRPKND